MQALMVWICCMRARQRSAVGQDSRHFVYSGVLPPAFCLHYSTPDLSERAAWVDPDILDQAIHHAVAVLNSERNRDLLGNQRISA